MKVIDFVAGYTIHEAIEKARRESIKLKQPVQAIINDIVLIIDGNTNILDARQEYTVKLNLKYEIENIKRKMDKEKQR